MKYMIFNIYLAYKWSGKHPLESPFNTATILRKKQSGIHFLSMEYEVTEDEFTQCIVSPIWEGV